MSAGGEVVDIFVSYADADNEVPAGATQGWVTTLVGELQKVLRRKLGGTGARIWMDHHLAANRNVTEELLDKVGRSRAFLLVMSPGYQASTWCQREVAHYVATASSRGRTQSVFPIEIEPVNRAAWQPAIRSLSPVRFWYRREESIAPKLAGFPRPQPDEDSLYWKNVNELAHLIAQRLRSEPEGASAPIASVVVAETTDDLEPARQSVVSALRQRGDVVVLPSVDYPRGNEGDFLAGVRNDLGNASLYVQLLGQHMGRRAPGSARTFVEMQSDEALHRASSLQVMQWCTPELASESISEPRYRDVLTSEHVSRVGLEEFRRGVLQRLDEMVGAGKRAEVALVRRVVPVSVVVEADEESVTGEMRPANVATLSALGLSLYVQAAPEDRDFADSIADQLASAGASVQLSPEPGPGQTFLESLKAQEEALRLCDGVLLVYGRSPVTAISTAFQYALRVFGVKRPGIWSAVLDLPPGEKQRVPIRSRNLTTIECRAGFETSLLGDFFDGLREKDGGAMQRA